MATIRDVAAGAGVSIATVSRVFNGSTRVTEATRDRVWEIASRLEYWPNTAARSLTTSRTHVLGVLLPDLYGEFFSEVIRGIDHAARTSEFQVLISSSHADTASVITAARSMRGRIDGLVVMASDEGSADAVDQLTRRFPTVLINPLNPAEDCSTISIANFDGALEIVSHAVRGGHRRIAIVNGPPGNVDAQDRRRGYHSALREADIQIAAELEIPGDFSESSGHGAAEALLQLDERPTAVFVANDAMAVGLLSALRDAHVDVPEDMAVLGFDDITIARYLSPALTTVHVDAFGLGRRSVELLVERLGETARPKHRRETIPVELVVRRSCGLSSNGEQE